MADPVRYIRVLLQHVKRDIRANFRGKALLANTLYDQAEALRRYLERYHDIQMYEEDDYESGPHSQHVKVENYGTARTADASRQTLRRIVRDHGLDPGYRAVWFVEGETECAFFHQLAELRGIDLDHVGVTLVNLRGKDGLDKNKMLRELLQQHQREQSFAFISLDEDGGGDHVRVLKQLAKDSLLSAGYEVWIPDFEEANFSLGELPKIATKFAVDHGVLVEISEAEIRQRMRDRNQPAGKALVGLLESASVFQGKGGQWGKALADWTVEHPQERPAEKVFRRIVRAQWANYDGTLEQMEVDASGHLVEKRTRAT